MPPLPADIGGIDVFGYTANDFQITDANWKDGVETIKSFNEPGHFVTYPVQEWCGSSTAGGDHKVIFLGEEPPEFPYNSKGEHNRTLLWNEDMKGASADLGRWPIEELWDAYLDRPRRILSSRMSAGAAISPIGIIPNLKDWSRSRRPGVIFPGSIRM